MKVHNLLGEPMDDEDEKKMMAFFDTQSKTTHDPANRVKHSCD